MRFALWLALAVTLALPTVARPPKKAKLVPPATPNLVRAGRRPAYYNPKDLSQPPVLSAASAVLMDFDTGKVLWALNPDAKRYPASTTKILTALLFAENVPADTTVSCNDPKIGDVGESSLHIKPGERFRAGDLMKAFLLRSGNDAGVVIAQTVAGSVPAFAERMNQRAIELGATHSHFSNPHGLHDPQHFTTAIDLARIARGAMQNERFAEAVRVPTMVLERSISKDRSIVAKSKKLFYDKVAGADGIKTGYTRPAGHCFVGSATRGGRRLIAVVMGAKVSGCSDTIPVLEWGFARFGAEPVAHAGQSFGTVKVTGGSRADVPIAAGGDLRVPFDRLLGPATVRTSVQPVKSDAPITAGETVAKLRIDGEEGVEVPLLATRSVDRSAIPTPSGSGWPWALAGGGVALVGLIAWRHGTPLALRSATKGARRRRRRIAPDRRSLDRGRAR